jgi:pimeloyl-ACP methyl ester carboxylesterase
MSNRYPAIERCFVGTTKARIHIATAGTGRPILLLHQTPRSWDEYRDVLPLIGHHYRAVAMDTVGFGDSEALPFEENSIEAWSACAFDLLDALELPVAAFRAALCRCRTTCALRGQIGHRRSAARRGR